MQGAEFSAHAATQNAFDFHALGNSSFLPFRKGAKGLGCLCQTTTSSAVFFMLSKAATCGLWCHTLALRWHHRECTSPGPKFRQRAMPRGLCWESDAGQPSTRCVIIRVAATEL